MNQENKIRHGTWITMIYGKHTQRSTAGRGYASVRRIACLDGVRGGSRGAARSGGRAGRRHPPPSGGGLAVTVKGEVWEWTVPSNGNILKCLKSFLRGLYEI